MFTIKQTIKKLERGLGIPINESMVRFYDNEGLVVPERGEGNNYRLYTEENIQMLGIVIMLSTLGFELDTVKDLVLRPDFTVREDVRHDLKIRGKWIKGLMGLLNE